jgi:RNA polymerase sigma factor (sigma-70 family)
LDEWVVQAVAGNRSSLDSLLLHFHDPLRRFIGASVALGAPVGISHDDVLQEAIIAAIRGVNGITPCGADAFFAWLKTIARHSHLNMIKAAKTQKRGEGRPAVTGARTDDPTATSILGGIAGADPSPSLIYRRKEAIEAIALAIARLSPEQREMIELYYQSHVPVRDLAQKMGKSEEAVRTSIHRAVNRLREMLAADFGEFSAGL